MGDLLWAASLGHAAAAGEPLLGDGGHFDCLPIAGFGLRGVALWQPESEAKDKLGAPLRITEGGGVDDGGSYVETTYHYADMEFSVVRGVVDSIYTASPAVALDSGIRVGLSRAEVVEILGREPRDWQSDEGGFSLVTCPEQGERFREDYLELGFDDAGRLESIEFSASRP